MPNLSPFYTVHCKSISTVTVSFKPVQTSHFQCLIFILKKYSNTLVLLSQVFFTFFPFLLPSSCLLSYRTNYLHLCFPIFPLPWGPWSEKRSNLYTIAIRCTYVPMFETYLLRNGWIDLNIFLLVLSWSGECLRQKKMDF